MRQLLLLAIFVAFALGSTVDATFKGAAFRDFCTKYGKNYRSDEYARRFRIFSEAVDKIAQYNEENAAYGTTFGLTIFADLTHEEFLHQYVGNLTAPRDAPVPADETEAPAPQVTCPMKGTTCDWRNGNVVTPVKDQGSCGSCWSFSTTGNIEGAWALAKGSLVSLSEQNLLDCAGSAYGNYGCDGGLMTNAFSYIIKNKGIDTETSYAYTGVQSSCKFKAANIGATISSYSNVGNSESSLTSAVTNYGPIAVAIDASDPAFMYYQSGVYVGTACSANNLNHAVLAVGYGVSGSTPYYIVKNSWGVFWGMNGYINMSRSKGCGITSMASFARI